MVERYVMKHTAVETAFHILPKDYATAGVSGLMETLYSELQSDPKVQAAVMSLPGFNSDVCVLHIRDYIGVSVFVLAEAPGVTPNLANTARSETRALVGELATDMEDSFRNPVVRNWVASVQKRLGYSSGGWCCCTRVAFERLALGVYTPHAETVKALRGYGIVKSLYAMFLNTGQVFASDSHTAAAAAVWKSLQRDGFEISYYEDRNLSTDPGSEWRVLHRKGTPADKLLKILRKAL